MTLRPTQHVLDRVPFGSVVVKHSWTVPEAAVSGTETETAPYPTLGARLVLPVAGSPGHELFAVSE